MLSGCTDFFFYPHQQLLQTPEDLGLKYSNIELESETEPSLLGWFLPAKTDSPLATVVFLHGNAENISTHINSVYWLPERGFNVIMAEYRGYGGSEGKANIHGVHQDALRFLHYAQKQNKSDLPLILFGQSLGASIALKVASYNEVPLDLLVAESPFSSYPLMARDSLAPLGIFRYLLYPFTWSVSDEFDPIDVISDIDAPILLVHGAADRTVPSYHSELLKQARSDVDLILVDNKDHLEIFLHKTQRDLLEDKLSTFTKGQSIDN